MTSIIGMAVVAVVMHNPDNVDLSGREEKLKVVIIDKFISDGNTKYLVKSEGGTVYTIKPERIVMVIKS